MNTIIVKRQTYTNPTNNEVNESIGNSVFSFSLKFSDYEIMETKAGWKERQLVAGGAESTKT